MTEISRRTGSQEPQALNTIAATAPSAHNADLSPVEPLPVPPSDTAATFEGRPPSQPVVESADSLKEGRDVAAIQEQLRFLGFPLYMTGKFDKATAAALTKWQIGNGLPGTGQADPVTIARLMKPSTGLEEAQKLAGEKAAEVGDRALEYAEMRNGAKPPGVSTPKNYADFRCARWVHGALEDSEVDVADGIGEAYMYGDVLAADPQFKEVKVTRAELERLPAGAVVVWGKGDRQPHGHVGIVTSKADASGHRLQASDRTQPLSAFANASEAKKYGTNWGSGETGGDEFRVFIPLDAKASEQ